MADSRLINLTPAEVGAEVRAWIAIEDAVVDVDTPELQISGTIEVAEHAVWLAGPAEVFVAGTGQWVAAGTPPPAPLTVVASARQRPCSGTGLAVRQLTVDVGGVSSRSRCGRAAVPRPPAGVLVRLPVVAEPLPHPAPPPTIPDRGRPGVASVLDGGVTVEVDVRRRPTAGLAVVTWLLELAAGAGLDPETD